MIFSCPKTNSPWTCRCSVSFDLAVVYFSPSDHGKIKGGKESQGEGEIGKESKRKGRKTKVEREVKN